MLEYSYVANAYQTNYKDGLNYDDAALEKILRRKQIHFTTFILSLLFDFAYETPKTDDDSSSDSKTTEASEAEKKAKATRRLTLKQTRKAKKYLQRATKKLLSPERKTSSEASSLVGSDGQKWLTDSRESGRYYRCEGHR